jgi:beta-phosphoglucomutase-like phosphatase (HAD superfamily)
LPVLRFSCGSIARPMHRIQALLFDLDGTLVDSAEVNYTAYSRALAEFGVQMEPGAIAEIAASRQWRDFLPELLRGAGIEADAARIASRKGELYRTVVGDMRVNKPLLALAESVRPAIRTGLVTTATASSVSAILVHFGLRGLFDVVVTGDDVARHKPDPEAYRVAAERLEVPAEACLAFEDSDVGVASAVAAGMAVVRVQFAATTA